VPPRQQLQYAQSDYLRSANVEVESKPMEVKARILPAPDIEFGKQQTLVH
jgi:hypothetical protein